MQPYIQYNTFNSKHWELTGETLPKILGLAQVSGCKRNIPCILYFLSPPSTSGHSFQLSPWRSSNGNPAASVSLLISTEYITTWGQEAEQGSDIPAAGKAPCLPGPSHPFDHWGSDSPIPLLSSISGGLICCLHKHLHELMYLGEKRKPLRTWQEVALIRPYCIFIVWHFSCLRRKRFFSCSNRVQY